MPEPHTPGTPAQTWCHRPLQLASVGETCIPHFQVSPSSDPRGNPKTHGFGQSHWKAGKAEAWRPALVFSRIQNLHVGSWQDSGPSDAWVLAEECGGLHNGPTDAQVLVPKTCEHVTFQGKTLLV